MRQDNFCGINNFCGIKTRSLHEHLEDLEGSQGLVRTEVTRAGLSAPLCVSLRNF
jgi:hypothetical protein